jgi:hypothetical protein
MMGQLKKDLMVVAKDLKKLTQKTGKMIKQLEKLEKVQAAKKPKAKAIKKAIAKKPTGLSASGTVLAIIKRSRKGVDTAALTKKQTLRAGRYGILSTGSRSRAKSRGTARVFM